MLTWWGIENRNSFYSCSKTPNSPEGYLPSVHLDCKITKMPLIDRDKKILLSPPLNKKPIPLYRIKDDIG